MDQLSNPGPFNYSHGSEGYVIQTRILVVHPYKGGAILRSSWIEQTYKSLLSRASGVLIKLGIGAMTRCKSLIPDRLAGSSPLQLGLIPTRWGKGVRLSRRVRTQGPPLAGVGRMQTQDPFLHSSLPDVSQVYSSFLMGKKSSTSNLHSVEETGSPRLSEE